MISRQRVVPQAPASTIVEKFGGVGVVAKALNLNPSTVLRWTYAREVGGTGGVIPTKRQHQMLALATERGVTLAPADFFDMAS